MADAMTRYTNSDRVFEFLKSQRRPLTAYEILDALQEDGMTAATTVYRALTKLIADRRVHRIESLNAYTVCCKPNHSETPVFEICDACGNVTEHVGTAIARDIAEVSSGSGFSPEHSIIEIRGLCRSCGVAQQSPP
ncbi:MAG: transcriptional repressor [Aestuariivita sp.]|nr:transcriptional repressor [Aestuariivita sp.]MCY4202929.1 transcriptional repressor [Aestuariivita sp.]